MRAFVCAAGFLLAIHGPPANACGHCVEDKIAAVYDHVIVTKAQAQGHPVAFFAIDGEIVQDETTRRAIETMVRSTNGVDQDSVRVSLELASISFSFDPKRARIAAVVNALGTRLSSKNLRLLELKILDHALPLKAVRTSPS
ncbi:hypothetical protein [Janthinobacterium sp. 17J80-10]|uniref:hypothetical protein n=1 Tax=Janthinobacterium sp. 17J80-10 TaxID=2497863 RepID=UPI001005A09D|nr:hypothetical protein [Janthinobacterium sp. 17J80-10]QAU35205.1 hypothetical protein EKL02_14030 [Janthinobacterium sp. 17J80-10]